MKTDHNLAKTTALTGMLVAAAFIVSYIESLLPPIVPVPGIKIGLANVVVLFAIYLLGPVFGIGISVVRVILSGLTFGSLLRWLTPLQVVFSAVRLCCF